MGHIRLGRLPKTRKWQEVVGLLGARATAPEIAAATIDASRAGLKRAARDPALIQSFWLLTQLPLCARKADFVQELGNLGVSVAAEPTLTELIGGFSDAVDIHMHRKGGRTDLGEMAQMGAAESLATVLAERTASLFGSTAEDVRRELSRLGTPGNFSLLARDFFARLAERYLTYFLSRELSNQLGTIDANRQFREALSIHCRQASRIVEKFAADWFSKANYKGGITPRKVAWFIGYAMTKLGAELKQGAEGGEG
ncbi:MAG: hypothetical protein ACR2IV_12690 [Bryobacteraceae bacterium]